jgi:hypothetical protein
MMTTRKTERSQGPDCKSVTNLHSSPLLADGDLTEPPFVYALLRLLFSIQPSPHQPLLPPFAWREREVRSSRRQGARNSSTAEAGAGGRGKREARGSQPPAPRQPPASRSGRAAALLRFLFHLSPPPPGCRPVEIRPGLLGLVGFFRLAVRKLLLVCIVCSLALSCRIRSVQLVACGLRVLRTVACCPKFCGISHATLSLALLVG